MDPWQHPTSGTPITLCIVDDHAALRDQLVGMLASVGHEVLAAVGTVEHGLAAIVRHRPDVAVIDNQLPDGFGIDLCRVLATEVPGVRLVLHTGSLGRNTERDALEAGAHAVVAKGVRPTGLLEAIRGI